MSKRMLEAKPVAQAGGKPFVTLPTMTIAERYKVGDIEVRTGADGVQTMHGSISVNAPQGKGRVKIQGNVHYSKGAVVTTQLDLDGVPVSEVITLFAKSFCTRLDIEKDIPDSISVREALQPKPRTGGTRRTQAEVAAEAKQAMAARIAELIAGGMDPMQAIEEASK